MTDAGFTNVTERIVKVPNGSWPKDKRLKVWGQWFQYFVLQGLEGFTIRLLTEVLGVCSFLAYSRASQVLSSLALLTKHSCA